MKLVLALALLFATDAAAQDFADVMKAREISQLISASEPCGFALDDEDVAQFAETELPKMSDSARMMFQSAGGAMEIRLSEQPKTKRIATCAMLRGLARKYQFLK